MVEKSNSHLEQELLTLPRLNLRGRQLYDLELLLVGGFAPLAGFMDEEDYRSVVETMRLRDGTLFSLPIVLDVLKEAPFAVGERIILCDPFGNPLAIMEITSRYTPDKEQEAHLVYDTLDHTHPGVDYLFTETHPVYLGGILTKIALPQRRDFAQLRHTPASLKTIFKERGWPEVIGFQTRNPMHRAHFELVRRAHRAVGAPVLVHPVVGMTKPGDIDYMTRVRTYSVVCNTYGRDFTHLALLPLAMRMAGPREALWHALIRKNYGCTHFIVGRDHAGPGSDARGNSFYAPYAARDLALAKSGELGVTIVPSDELAYSPTQKKYIALHETAHTERVEHISGTEVRRRLAAGEEIPEWFSFPESIAILRESARRNARKGVVFFFTGLSGAGKSTIAELLYARLEESLDCSITFLDGDIVRQHLTKGLGFSKEDRDENVRRVGFVAAEVVKHGGIAICALIAPYRESREYVRHLVEQYGTFIEVYVETSLEECERRDTKGLYAKARQGLLEEFTGVSSPYESPDEPEITLKTEAQTPEALADEVYTYFTRTLG